MKTSLHLISGEGEFEAHPHVPMRVGGLDQLGGAVALPNRVILRGGGQILGLEIPELKKTFRTERHFRSSRQSQPSAELVLKDT